MTSRSPAPRPRLRLPRRVRRATDRASSSNPAGLPDRVPGRGFATFRRALLEHRTGEVELDGWRPTAGSDLGLQLSTGGPTWPTPTFYNERIANDTTWARPCRRRCAPCRAPRLPAAARHRCDGDPRGRGIGSCPPRRPAGTALRRRRPPGWSRRPSRRRPSPVHPADERAGRPARRPIDHRRGRRAAAVVRPGARPRSRRT